MIVATNSSVKVTTCSLKDNKFWKNSQNCLLYTSPSPRD